MNFCDARDKNKNKINHIKMILLPYTIRNNFSKRKRSNIFGNSCARIACTNITMKVYCQNVLARKSVFSCTAFIFKFEILQQQVKANSTQLASL